MSDSEFLFALELSDEASFDRMLNDVAKAVFLHLGVARADIDTLAAELRAALANAARAGHRRCELRFRVQNADLEVVVTSDGGAEWRTTRRLP